MYTIQALMLNNLENLTADHNVRYAEPRVRQATS